MSVTLNQILMLVGTLDDSPGFDTPCRRFRRFLTEHVTDVCVARSLIEQCQQSSGEGQRGALQDLIVLLGRFLGFETTFGCYQPLAGALRYDGHWRSRHDLTVVLEIRTDQTPISDLRSLSRSVAALAATSDGSATHPGQAVPDSRSLGLCVLTPPYVNRVELGRALTEGKPTDKLRMVSLQPLLALVDMVSTGRLTHDDVLRLFDSSIVLDVVVDLLQRSAAFSSESGAESRFWFATIVAEADTPQPQQVVESIIRKRREFRPSATAAAQCTARPGDWICFCIPGTGVVGHAQVASFTQEPAALHLQRIDLYLGAPVVPDFQTQLRITAAHGNVDPAEGACFSISRDEFAGLTRHDERMAGPRQVPRAEARRV